MYKLPLYKRLLSYVFPVKLAAAASPQNAVLELCYYKGQYQLATYDALYSDGNRYRPLRLAVNYLQKRKAQPQTVLVLGTGLGSIVRIMHQHGYQSSFVLVEHDATILQWAADTLPDALLERITPVHEDAQKFIASDTGKYDWVVVDIFNSRVVPDFVTAEPFLLTCKRALNNKGYFILNYIVINKDAWQKTRHLLEKTFSKIEVLEDGMNRIVIATA
ncbi:hypothetical protein CAP35_00795 [Chitinophagaceae bacterium IBVUCB1]|nr:hypothetical protein CAP35_00795 [Chitinophagaceae bacterium IBVUCB1]